MADEIIEELWRIKDDFARKHGYDVRRMGEYLRSLEGRGVEGALAQLREDAAKEASEQTTPTA